MHAHMDAFQWMCRMDAFQRMFIQNATAAKSPPLTLSACSNDLNVSQNLPCNCDLLLLRIVRYGCSRDENTVAHQASQVAIKTHILLGMNTVMLLISARGANLFLEVRGGALIRVKYLFAKVISSIKA